MSMCSNFKWRPSVCFAAISLLLISAVHAQPQRTSPLTRLFLDVRNCARHLDHFYYDSHVEKIIAPTILGPDAVDQFGPPEYFPETDQYVRFGSKWDFFGFPVDSIAVPVNTGPVHYTIIVNAAIKDLRNEIKRQTGALLEIIQRGEAGKIKGRADLMNGPGHNQSVFICYIPEDY